MTAWTYRALAWSAMRTFVRRLVGGGGGSLSIESKRDGSGTSWFDTAQCHTPIDGQCTSETKPPLRGSRRRLRILLVEDNGTNRLVASRMVERAGHRVDAVVDGADAVRAVRSIPYDLILMDVMMPGMDGLTATRLIRGEPGVAGWTPIIGLTANAERSMGLACLDAGMDGFVSKPVTAERLAAAIEAVILANGADAAVPCSLPLLDTRVLGLLADDIGDDSAVDVARLFLTEAPRMIQRLEQASIDRGRALLREVHTLASAARSVGLQRVGHVAADIERTIAGREPDAEQLAELLDLLRQSVVCLAEWQGHCIPPETTVTANDMTKQFRARYARET